MVQLAGGDSTGDGRLTGGVSADNQSLIPAGGHIPGKKTH